MIFFYLSEENTSISVRVYFFFSFWVYNCGYWYIIIQCALHGCYFANQSCINSKIHHTMREQNRNFDNYWQPFYLLIYVKQIFDKTIVFSDCNVFSSKFMCVYFSPQSPPLHIYKEEFSSHILPKTKPIADECGHLFDAEWSLGSTLVIE